MASSFQVDTDRIQAASVDIAAIAADIESQVQAMMGRLTALEDAWRGSAAAQFQGLIASWQGTQTQVRTSLDDIGRVLGQAGAQYADVEAQTAAMFA